MPIACDGERLGRGTVGSMMKVRLTLLLMTTLLALPAFGQRVEAPPTATAPPADAELPTPDVSDTPPLAPGVNDTSEMPPAYDIKLRELEENVVGLKERIFKTKTRLLLFKEQILHNVIAEARAVIIHKNDMGASFTLEQVLYYLDNDKIYFQDNRDGVLDTNTEFEIFNGNVLPGNHMISVELVYRGNGTLFSYIDGYRFKIQSNYTFYASKGRITKIQVVGYERGGITTDLEQKPYVKYEVQQHRYSRDNLEKAKEGALGKE